MNREELLDDPNEIVRRTFTMRNTVRTMNSAT